MANFSHSIDEQEFIAGQEGSGQGRPGSRSVFALGQAGSAEAFLVLSQERQ
jgi:hypothetical protein